MKALNEKYPHQNQDVEDTYPFIEQANIEMRKRAIQDVDGKRSTSCKTAQMKPDILNNICINTTEDLKKGASSEKGCQPLPTAKPCHHEGQERSIQLL